ncbi:MAG: acetolactate synthase small subunit [Dehalococcoidia bacterium]|nr:acetolactate synthase small subunit [Dehalococcoidia bacterium]
MTTNGAHQAHQHTARQHTITALVMDHPGVLNRVASMFRRRGFNIASLAVGASEIPGQSRMTFVVNGDDATVEQVTKQLRKIIEVVKVTDLSQEDIVARELALVKVKTPSADSRAEVIQIVELFRAKVIDVGADTVTIEITGDENKIASIMTLLKGFGVVEVMRTGRVAMSRGRKAPVRAAAGSAKAKASKA